MNYPIYSNQFQIQELQNMRERIDNQIRQIQQPQPITQNFQLAPNPGNKELEGKYAKDINEVKNTFVMKVGLFVDKDYSTLWIKDVSGNIRTFNLQEVIEMDEKDKQILDLKKEIEEMKGMMKYECNNNNVDEPVTVKKSSRVSTSKKSNE